MCFSASMSFGASVVLRAVGTVALKKAKTPSMKVFAMTPIFFGIQQLSEGMVWLSLMNPESSFSDFWLSKSVYTFLFFAWVIWPVFIPYFMIKLEDNQQRKKILKRLFVNGVGVVAILIFVLLTYQMTARIDEYHIRYDRDYNPSFVWVFAIFYLASTVFPTFISSVKNMWYLGAINLASYVFAKIFFSGFVISIWCFFGAVSSLVVLAIILQNQKSAGLSKNNPIPNTQIIKDS